MHKQAFAVLLAKQEIADVLATYARAADRVDLDLLRSVFHPGAIADYGQMFQGTGEEFAAFIGEAHPGMETHAHHVGNILINVDGDHAGSECYVIARIRFPGRDGGFTDIINHGRYVDRWERRDGRWRIAHRLYLHTMDETRTVPASSFPERGTRDRDDPSYAVLAIDPLTRD